MESLSFTQIIIIIISLIFGIIAIKIAINFDINKYLERKDKILVNKIQNTCLHISITHNPKENNYIYKSLFVSPSGTLQWQCQRCSMVCDHIDRDQQKEIAKYYINNPQEYKKQEERFHKLLKKKGIL